jgi:glycosyltransferase involved in cell wall biosynthesis
MLWSILITSVPSRIAGGLAGLVTDLDQQTKFEPNIEVLALLDNKQRTVGSKRNILLNMAQGEYISFVDDDDQVSPGYVAKIVNAIERKPDVVVFDVLCTVGKQKKFCHYGIEYKGFRCKILDNGDEEWFARPYHVHTWKREVVGWFPNTSLGEDVQWADNINISNLDQVKLDETLYYYRYDPKNTEIPGR